MSSKKCCCCGLLSCFPCFSDKKSTLSAQPDSSEIASPPLTVITNPSPAATLSSAPSHQLSSSAPPSAAAPSQVNASIVMQNDSQPTAPSAAVPSSSRGIVTPSALIPTTSQTTASPPTQPPSSSTPSSSRLPKESGYAETIMEAVKELDKENVDGDFSDKENVDGDFSDKENVDVDLSDLAIYISELLRFIEEKEKGKNQSMPKAAAGSCLASKNFLRLKDVVSEGVNAVAEMDLCQFDVINQIDMRLRKGQELKYPEYPKGAVGIEDPWREVNERLEMGSDKNAVAVIVHGFGGMGKTTLADAVFARLFDAKEEGYKYSYVRLFDTIASVPDVVKLQRCILTDLMMVEESEIPEIRRYEEGQQVIEDVLEKEAAFIYIDNVLLPDKVEQGRDALHHLLPKNMRNARKLRLLLTTRDKDAVRIRGVKPVFYPIKGLPHEEALDLFKKTLDGDSLQQLDTDQLNHLVKICERVPKLMMVVAGFISSEENVQQAYSAVLEESKINWKGEIGNDMECYIFAYENLEETLKEIFLDICVFFQGWDWKTLSNIVGEEDLKMLEKRALVTKDVKSMTVRVHDVMLAIGLDKKGERFRFTRASDFQKFLMKDNDQLEKIKGICSSDDSNLLYIPASKLDLMHRSLRVVLLGKSTQVEGKCKEIFEELVIFRARDSDPPFDASKLKEFKKLSHLICKSEDLENLSEEKEKGKGKGKGKEKEKEKGNSPSKPEVTRNYWPGSNFFFKLKDVLAEGIVGIKDVPTGDANKIARDLVKHVGMAHLVTTGFLVVANILERYEAISTNKGACLSLLKEMDKLVRHVNELRKRPELKESMVDSIREAIALIVEASIACCTQINATKFSKFFSTTVNGEELAKFKTRLAETDTHMQRNFNLCLYDAIVRPQKPMELQYPEYPKGAVGIEKQLEKVIELLECGSDKNAVAVILHGFGGMGKTTLADAVFAWLLNAEMEGYKYSYVRLFDDIASPPNIVELQKFIIKYLKMGEEPKEFQRYEEGQRQIESILAKEAVLIYIDNVLLEQNRNALEDLLPKDMGNARKLRLLFTARDKDAVRISGVKPVFYPIEGLPHEKALELFKKTLDGDSQQQLLPNQLEQLVKICEGVPKLMMVVAGFINGKLESKQKAYDEVMEESQKNWKGKIGKDINRYVFAYDKLEDELKDPFLDVCSFFRGWDWKELSDIVGDTKLKRLEERALVTRDVKSMTARVPDVILQVGLQRAEGNRFRLTTATEIEKFLDVEDLQKIKGIWASDNKDPLRIPASKLDLMSGSLRVLKLGPLTDVEGKCEKEFEELVFVSAITSHLPFNVSKLKGFEKLRHLCYNPADLQNLSQMPSNLRHVDIKLNSPAFQVSSHSIQRLRNLRVLRLSNAQFKSLPQEIGDMGNGLEDVSISGCQYLEELSISGCQYLEEVSISMLKSLRVLRMDGCSGLTQLSKGLESLTFLQELYLYGCKSLEALPSELENLTSLQKFDLSWCGSLKALPSSLGKLRSLQELRLHGCESLQALPSSLEELSSLRFLDLSFCQNIKDLPCGLEKLTSLVGLKLNDCRQLSSIPGTIGQLKLNSIDFSSSNLKELPDGFCNFSTLTELDMTNCHLLEKLPERFGEVSSLRKLIMTSCRSLQKLPDSFNQLKYLEYLDLSACSTLEELCKDFEGLSLLRLLSLKDCDKLKKLPEDFQCLTSLEVLDVRNCHKLEGKWIDSMLKMKKLQMCRIAGSKGLEERWEKIQAQQCNQSWSCAVYTEQGLSNEENLLKQLQSEFDSMLTNGERPLNISGLPLNTLLLVMFDGRQDFGLHFPLPLLEESIDDIETHFEMVYFGNHFNKLPEKVANRIVGHAPANRDAKALFQKLLPLVVNFPTDSDWRVNGSFQITAEIVSGKKGEKYLSSWKFSEEDGVEDFVVTKCRRYLKLKQLAERGGGSPTALLTEVFRGGEEENSVSFLKNKDGESTKVGVDELKGKTILLDIRPANICYAIPLQALVEMYVVEKEKFGFEIITIPLMQKNTKSYVSVEFSREVPWLVLEKPWQLTNATKYFLLEGCPRWREGWDRWYPNRMRIIESNGTIAPYTGVLRMVNTWGAAAYPFTAEKEEELIQKEKTQMEVMSHAMFLFQHLERVAEQLREATVQQKMIWLCCCHEKEFTNSMKNLLTELSETIYIVYIPNFHRGGGVKFGYFTATIYEKSYSLEPSKMSSAEMGRIFSLSLSEYEAMRFWARIRSLKEGIIAKDQIQLWDIRSLKEGIKAKNQIQLREMLRIPDDDHYFPRSWMFIMNEDGNLITTKGKELVKLLSENIQITVK